VFEIVSHMTTYGESISSETVVSKVPRSLIKIPILLLLQIEESKDLSKYNFDELMSSCKLMK